VCAHALTRAWPCAQVTVQTGEALAAAKEEIIVQRRFDHPCLLPMLSAATVDTAGSAAGASAATTSDDGDDAVPTQHVLMLFPAYTVRTCKHTRCSATRSRRVTLPALAHASPCACLRVCVTRRYTHTHTHIGRNAAGRVRRGTGGADEAARCGSAAHHPAGGRRPRRHARAHSAIRAP
jgi:hypothetical protein